MITRNWLIILLVFVAALVPRVLDLGAILSPDEPQWEENTRGFLQGLRERDFLALYQQHHPGITTMWLAAPVIESGSWAVKRAPQAVALSALVAVAAFFMMRLWGAKVGLAGGLLLALNPLFVAHSRVLAMDALLGIFLLLSALFLLAWQREKVWWWAALSGAAGALAVLSKLPGIVIGVWAALFFLWELWRQKESRRHVWRAARAWLTVFVLTLLIVFPTIVVAPGKVYAGVRYFFEAEQYQYQHVHALGSWWYPQALLLWTTPLHWIAFIVGLCTLSALAFSDARRSPQRASRACSQLAAVKEQTLTDHAGGASVRSSNAAPRESWSAIFWILALAVLFFIMMQISLKKGDRYILPDFLVFDVLTVLIIATAWPRLRARWQHALAGGLIAVAAVWQVGNVIALHPYYLAYRNPFFRSVAVGRTMGWGEGLDLAAEYLNAKPNAKEMLVISYYESSFAHRFVGQVTSAERLAKETPEEIGGKYVVLYRTMQGRAPDRWETLVLQQFADKTPEHVISLNGEDYVWIYRVSGR